jgi:hypothetical protein
MSFAGLIDVIHWLEDVFERLQLQRSYGGAIAYNYYAPPRLTQDVDVLALVPDTKIPELEDVILIRRLPASQSVDVAFFPFEVQ